MRMFCCLVLSLLIFSIPAIAVETISIVEKQPEAQPEKSLWQTVKSLWWVALIIIGLLGLALWGLIVLIKKLKEGTDVWFQIAKDKKHLCRIHRDRHRVRAFFRYRKNCPIRIYYTNSSQLHAKTVGYYKGHYLSHEGNMCILFNCRRKWLVLPKPDLLFLNSRSKIIVSRSVPEKAGSETKYVRVVEEMQFPHNFYNFSQEEIIIYARGIDMDYRTGFYYPVLKDKDGNIVNMALPVYESVKQIAIEGYLYDQTDDFVKVAKKSIDLNPMIRGVNKVSDSSSSIETQQQGFGGG